MKKLPLTATLHEAKKELRENWEQGVECPCCTQYVKLYHRKLNTGITLFLIGLYKLCGPTENYFHAKQVLEKIGGFTTSRDYAILEHWGLIKAKPNEEDPSKRTSGYWALTEKGFDFVIGAKPVMSHVKLFNNKFYGFTGKMISVREALGNKFDYEELN